MVQFHLGFCDEERFDFQPLLKILYEYWRKLRFVVIYDLLLH